jgi:hypothetical protein
LGSLPPAILWTWPYHVSWFCSISYIIVFSSPICCLIVTFVILSFLDILEDLLRRSISVASVSEPYNKLLLINTVHMYISVILPTYEISAWNLPVPNVQYKIPDDGQRRCPKRGVL